MAPQQGKRGSDVVICGNKCDLQGREVAREEGEQLAAELGVPYMETSAKDNLNVEETFGNLASRVSEFSCFVYGQGSNDTGSGAVDWDERRWM